MNHVYWIYPDQLAGRPGPTMEPWNLALLREAGFSAMLSVANERDYFHGDAQELGIERAAYPLPDVIPADHRVKEACRLLLPLTHAFIDEQLRMGKRVMVHCVHGNDRTGLVLASYMARREGLDGRTALDRFRAVRPGALQIAGWERMTVELIDEMEGNA